MYLNELNVRKILMVLFFTKKSEELRSLQRGSEFDNFKPLLKCGIFKCIS